jgi:iron complex transport system permease protein
LSWLALFVLSLLTGPAGFGPGESLRALLTGQGEAVSLVMREIRLPRAILAVMVGASLGLSGAALAGLPAQPAGRTRADRRVGIRRTGRRDRASDRFRRQLRAGPALRRPTGALIAVLLILALAGPRGGSLTLILAGIAISALAGALTSLVLNLSPNPFAVSETVFWMLGSLSDRSFWHVGVAAALHGAGLGPSGLTARGLDALTLGEDAAASLGIRLNRLRLMIVFGTASAVGAATAVAGAIGFVGLVVPHILRPFLGARPAPAPARLGARRRGTGAGRRHRRAPGPARPRPEARRAHGHRRRAAVPAPDLQDAEAARVTLLSLNLTVRRGECPVVDDATLASARAKSWA